ncbi:MAG: MaoC family dehydratase N-terminal domain-containing protein [Deltaproteobacteria bacterium]|nr:MaoC family dehydratase N-terminal domain-containing protein [Deltaproteobacteria bacterium]MBW2308357.1 MaoC family dehydratase N-terminal domain-containing protein [Deltaproteobacteria bacterium]
MDKKGAVAKKVQLSQGRITEEGLEELRRRVGKKFKVDPFHTLVCKDSIRHFVDGIGDVNPLYRDEGYAKKTRYGTVIAPPSWLYSVFPTWIPQGLKGVHAFHSGNDWTFFKPLFEGNIIAPECTFTHFEEKKSRFAGRIIIVHYDNNFYNQFGERVANAKSWSVRAERKAAQEKGKYAEIQVPHPWTEDELKMIEEQVLGEQIRGAKVRYWEDVREGETLPALVKGPLGITDIIAWCIGSAPVRLKALGAALREYNKHPAWAFRDPRTGALEPTFAVHYNIEAARGAGVPYPYDVGVQRQQWLIQHLTDWIGDDGWLKKCYAEYRRFVYLSDVIWLHGKVTRKYADEEGECCVDIETWAENQRGENIMPGHSTVVLPSRDKGTWPLERRLAVGKG